MKKALFIFCCFWLAAVNVSAQIPASPNPPRLCNDFANVLNESECIKLHNKLTGYFDKTSTQIAIVLVANTGNLAIEDYAQQLFEKWGVGMADKNNGVLLLLSVDKNEVRIHTGYGVEGALTDIECSTIINEDLIPAFKDKNYFTGLDIATDHVMTALEGEFTSSAKSLDTKRNRAIIAVVVLILVLVLLTRGAKFRGRTRTFYSSRRKSPYKNFSGFGGGKSGGGGATGRW